MQGRLTMQACARRYNETCMLKSLGMVWHVDLANVCMVMYMYIEDA
jgi:hypothetical protein